MFFTLELEFLGGALEVVEAPFLSQHQLMVKLYLVQVQEEALVLGVIPEVEVEQVGEMGEGEETLEVEEVEVLVEELEEEVGEMLIMGFLEDMEN